jgi:hypothetical protein
VVVLFAKPCWATIEGNSGQCSDEVGVDMPAVLYNSLGLPVDSQLRWPKPPL